MLHNLSASVLIVQDLDKCREFYESKFGLEALFNDEVSSAYKMGNLDFVLLQVDAAKDMMGEEAFKFDSSTGQRVLLCVGVEDVDVTYQALTAKGLAFIKAPKSQDWGRRTAYFADLEGNLWEIWHSLSEE